MREPAGELHHRGQYVPQRELEGSRDRSECVSGSKEAEAVQAAPRELEGEAARRGCRGGEPCTVSSLFPL